MQRLSRPIRVHVADDDDAMHVIGHDHKRIQIHIACRMLGNLRPIIAGDLAKRRKVHFAAVNFAEERQVVARANGDEIPACRDVIPTAQARGFDAVFILEMQVV